MNPESFNMGSNEDKDPEKNLEVVPDENPTKEAVQQYRRDTKGTEMLGTQADIDAVEAKVKADQIKKFSDLAEYHEEQREIADKEKTAAREKIDLLHKEADRILFKKPDAMAKGVDELLAEQKEKEVVGYLDKAIALVLNIFKSDNRALLEKHTAIQEKIAELTAVMDHHHQGSLHHNTKISDMIFEQKKIKHDIPEKELVAQDNTDNYDRSMAA